MPSSSNLIWYSHLGHDWPKPTNYDPCLYVPYHEHADPRRNTPSFLQVPLSSEPTPATVEIRTPKERRIGYTGAWTWESYSTIPKGQQRRTPRTFSRRWFLGQHCSQPNLLPSSIAFLLIIMSETPDALAPRVSLIFFLSSLSLLIARRCYPLWYHPPSTWQEPSDTHASTIGILEKVEVRTYEEDEDVRFKKCA